MTTTTDRRQGVNSSNAMKSPVKAATTANITLSGEQTIDGVSIVADDRVLVKDQSTASENGIYIASTSTWSRAPDWDGSYDVVQGTTVRVNSGTANSGKWFSVTTSGTITVGTTSVTISSDLPPSYETGTWTPVLSDGTNNATASIATGFYTKVGRAVTITARLKTSSLGSVSGSLRITGLPYDALSTANSHASLTIGYGGALNLTQYESVLAHVQIGSDYINLYTWDDTAGATNMQESEWSADGDLFFSGTYFTD